MDGLIIPNMEVLLDTRGYIHFPKCFEEKLFPFKDDEHPCWNVSTPKLYPKMFTAHHDLIS